MTTNFFDEQKEQSKVKTLIVTKYFEAWARVIMGVQDANNRGRNGGNEIQYLDLFAGPGYYTDGTKSTPIIILEKAIQNNRLRERLVTTFNDEDNANFTALSQAIYSLPDIKQLKHPPQVSNFTVDSDIVTLLQSVKIIPTFFFIDPWGYKGLSLELINSILKDWGSDCVFFFNYNRINMGISNPMVEHLMNDIFGEVRANDLRVKCENCTPQEREQVVVEEICNALRATIRSSTSSAMEPYVLPFRFRDEYNKKTSHHLIFVSKNVVGYKIMKDVMARESSNHDQGVASFEYNAATADQPFLFGLIQPISELGSKLTKQFAGRTMTMKEIFNAHHVDTPYIEKNYKDALTELEASGTIITEPPAHTRRKVRSVVTFADTVKVTFPAKINP